MKKKNKKIQKKNLEVSFERCRAKEIDRCNPVLKSYRHQEDATTNDGSYRLSQDNWMSISRRDNRRFHRIVIPYLVYTRCTSCTLADWVCSRRWISTVLTRHRMNHRRWTTHLRDFNLWLRILLLVVVVRNTTSLIGEPDQTILRSILFENISSIYYQRESSIY